MASQTTQRIPILLYHSISDSASEEFLPYSLSPAMFEQHMAYLHTENFSPMTVSQFVIARNHNQLPDKPVVVTFDDGLEDFYTYAMPVLQRYQIPATMYVVAGYVGKTSLWLQPEGEGERPMMTWTQLKEIAAAGIEIGAHTMSHPQLDVLSQQAALEEIHESKKRLEAGLGMPITSLAYPHGYHSGAIIRMARDAGFTSACAVKNAMSVPNDDLFALARVTIFNDCDVDHLADILVGKDVPVTWQNETVKTKVWRMVRRLKQGRSPIPLALTGLVMTLPLFENLAGY